MTNDKNCIILRTNYLRTKNLKLLINLDIAKILFIVYLFGILASTMIIQFLGIFKRLREEKVFDKENIKGCVVLNEIYKRAIKYKEENDLTI